MTQSRVKRTGRFKRGAVLLTVGGKQPTTTKGEYAIPRVGGKVVSHNHCDNSATIGRRITTQQGGLANRAEWVRLQSGGLTPSELLRQADD